jgi:hypothetical protein
LIGLGDSFQQRALLIGCKLEGVQIVGGDYNNLGALFEWLSLDDHLSRDHLSACDTHTIILCPSSQQINGKETDVLCHYGSLGIGETGGAWSRYNIIARTVGGESPPPRNCEQGDARLEFKVHMRKGRLFIRLSIND